MQNGWYKKEDDKMTNLYLLQNEKIFIEHIYNKETKKHTEIIYENSEIYDLSEKDQKKLEVMFNMRIMFAKNI